MVAAARCPRGRARRSGGRRGARRRARAVAAGGDPRPPRRSSRCGATDDENARRAASRAAARLAARLCAHDLPATARGRLARLSLAADPAAAAAAVRCASAIVDGPLVTALTGARPPELDDLVAEHDLAVVAADPGSPLARAALASLAAHGIAATACAPLGRGVQRKLAIAGLAAPRLDIAGLAARRGVEAR